MARAITLGRTAADTRASISTTGNTGSVSTYGQMAGNILDSGRTGNNMGRAYTDKRMGRRGKASGKMENGLSGWMNDFNIIFILFKFLNINSLIVIMVDNVPAFTHLNPDLLVTKELYKEHWCHFLASFTTTKPVPPSYQC